MKQYTPSQTYVGPPSRWQSRPWEHGQRSWLDWAEPPHGRPALWSIWLEMNVAPGWVCEQWRMRNCIKPRIGYEWRCNAFAEFSGWAISTGWCEGRRLKRKSHYGAWSPGNCVWTGRAPRKSMWPAL